MIGNTMRAILLAGGATAALVSAPAPACAQDRAYDLDIPAMDLGQALRTFARTTREQIVFSGSTVRGRRSNAVRGSFTAREGLERMTAGSDLSITTGSGGIFMLRPVGSPGSGEAEAAGAAAGETSADDQAGYSEILVTGQRPTLNADIRRTEDDTQPYVVFQAEEIQRSGVTNLEDFIRTRLPMLSSVAGVNQRSLSTAATGGLALRGLSSQQTLILVDGRRLPDVGVAGNIGVGQPNINGIPTSAIERIEVLPATAGGIYGGGAVGGVINIILKRDYTGLEVQASYGNAFDTDVGYASLSLNGGFSVEDGRTRVTFSLSRSRQNQLQYSDRDFQVRARERNLINRPFDFTSPILALTPNICSTTGTSTSCPIGAPNLILDNGIALNSRFTSVPIGYAGASSDNGAAPAALAGRFNFNPAVNSQLLYSAPELQAYMLAIRRTFSSSIEAFVDLGFDRTLRTSRQANTATVNLAANDPGNPFQQNIAVNVPLPDSVQFLSSNLENIRARGGIIARLGSSWNFSLEHSWSRSINSNRSEGRLNLTPAAAYLRSIALRDPNAFAVTPISGGAVELVETSGPYKTELNDSILRFSGRLFRLPGGPLTLSGYVERREQDIAGSFSQFGPPPTPPFTYYAPKSQRVTSGYLEARAPLIAPSLGWRFAHSLELVAAIRRETYRTVSSPQGNGVSVPSRDGPLPSFSPVNNEVSSTDFTVGLSYAPSPDVSLRVSFGTSFLPPSLEQIIAVTSPPTNLSSVIDPRRGNTPLGSVSLITGGSPDLQPEQSESFSAGLIFTPSFIPGLRFSADYTRIQKSNEISGIPGGLAGLLAVESDFSERVIRGPLTPADQALGYTGGPIVTIDFTQFNLASTSIAAWDFQLDYALTTRRVGTFRPYLVATMQTDLTRQILSTDPLINGVGFLTSPLRWRGNLGVNWEMSGWSAGWNAQYYHSYNVCFATDTAAVCAPKVQRQGSARIPRQVYHDVFLSYDFGDQDAAGSRILANTAIWLGIQNVFNQSPPVFASTTGSGYDNYADPRLRRFVLTVRRRF